MTTLTLEGHYGNQVTVDFCEPCQAFWFDGMESLELAAASVLRLFKIVGSAGGGARPQLSPDAACPRCHRQLRVTHDQQRASRFEYRQCVASHGRLISFFNFLREKDFIRPMSAAQLDELRKNLQAVNCSNCGAPIDLAKATVCAHCGSALSILDMGQAEALVAKLRGESTRPSRIDPSLRVDVMHARQDVEAAFAAFSTEPGWYGTASSGGLVNAALGALSRWLSD